MGIWENHRRQVNHLGRSGVWDTTPEQTVYLFIDVKTSGRETFQAVITALKPLRDAGYLTSLVDNRTMTMGPVTVIGTGNTPFDMVGPVADRDYFFDAPLDSLNELQFADITSFISPIASADFEAAVGLVKEVTDPVLTDAQLGVLREQIATAESRGIGARYWNTPYFPIRTRDAVWRTLLREGVFLLNADDLESVVEWF